MFDVLWDEDATEDKVLDTYQTLVNNGQAWRLEGHVGRTAMDLLESRQIALGETGHTDYYGNYIPSRYEVQPGTKGAAEYARF
jgi:hypothetical protein